MNYIYCYTNRLNGHKYVGQTNDIERRKREHRSCALNANNKQYLDLFHRKLRQYGEESFDFEVLEVVTDGAEATNKAEIKWIATLKTYCGDGFGGYNMTRGGATPVKWIYNDRAEAIREAIKGGWSYEAITKTYEISPGHISNINHGRYYYDENESYPLRKFYKDEDEIEAIQDLLINSSFKMTEIAEMVGMGYSTIKKINSGALQRNDSLSYPLRKESAGAQRANKIKSLLLDGKSNAEIIALTGASTTTINRINNGETFKDSSLKYPLR